MDISSKYITYRTIEKAVKKLSDSFGAVVFYSEKYNKTSEILCRLSSLHMVAEEGKEFYLGTTIPFRLDYPVQVNNGDIPEELLPLSSYYTNSKLVFDGTQLELVGFVSEKSGIDYHRSGRSGFAKRNRLFFSLPYKKEVRKVVVIETKEIVEKEVEVVDIKEASKLIATIEKYVKEFWAIKDKEIAEKIKETVGSHGYITYGGRSGFSYGDIERAGYVVLFEYRSANTKDYRQGLTHTYTAYIISRDFDGKEKLKVEDEHKGMAIGKGGRNIKKVQSELNVRLSV